MSEQEHQAAKDVLAAQLAVNEGKVVQTCLPFLCCTQQQMPTCDPRTMCCRPGDPVCPGPNPQPIPQPLPQPLPQPFPPCDPRFECCYPGCWQQQQSGPDY
ncbi:hypothetical protein CDD80_7312 [Ophiocordyceps camponoti-rufipedis]|uniref:Uncharacterized protein n=1 Tax=Ophiocordyceps camponoti-rufipedis TaxID=2004952 RepID=A0A2C5ZFQ6_9HYPO|nr:hypothetical protein CDD80_7312 [Ophiocordyceps camponoti-rufipedis]